MGPTISLLAAGLLATQTAAPAPAGKTCNCQKNAGVVTTQQVAAEPSTSNGFFRNLFRPKTEAAPETPVAAPDERPILSKLQGIFGRKNSEPEVAITPEPPQNKANPFRQMQRLPAGPTGTAEPSLAVPNSTPAPVKVQPVTFQATAANSPSVPATTTANVPQPTPTAQPQRPSRISPDLIRKCGHETDYSWITGQLRIENGMYVIYYAAPDEVDVHNGSLVVISDHDLRGFHDGDYVSLRGQVTGVGGRTMYRASSVDRLPR